MKKLMVLAALLVAPATFAQDVDAGPPVAAVVAPAAPQDAGSGPTITAAPVNVTLPAAPDLSAGDGVPAMIGAISNAVVNKDWGKLIFLVVTAIVWGLRKFLGPKVPFLSSKLGGIILTFVVSFTGMLSTAWAPGAAPTGKAVLTALYMGFLAAGGWSILKNLLEHFTKKGAALPDPKPTV